MNLTLQPSEVAIKKTTTNQDYSLPSPREFGRKNKPFESSADRIHGGEGPGAHRTPQVVIANIYPDRGFKQLAGG